MKAAVSSSTFRRGIRSLPNVNKSEEKHIFKKSLPTSQVRRQNSDRGKLYVCPYTQWLGNYRPVWKAGTPARHPIFIVVYLQIVYFHSYSQFVLLISSIRGKVFSVSKRFFHPWTIWVQPSTHLEIVKTEDCARDKITREYFSVQSYISWKWSRVAD